MSGIPKSESGSRLNETGTTAQPTDVSPGQFPGKLFRAFSFSPEIIARAGLFLVALCLVKLVMVVDLRRQLFDAYWRVGGGSPTWVNDVLFIVFVAVLGLNLWKFSKRYEAAGTSMIRKANLLLLGFAALFIALTFHEGDKNHLHPLLYGSLKLDGLASYYSLNFFFRQPYLALWVLAYAITYYLMTCSGREHRMLRATAIFASAYTLVCLRELRVYGEELFVINSLGIACLLFGGRSRRGLNLAWILLPIGFVFLFFVMFRPHTGSLSDPSPESVIMMLGSCVVLAGLTLLAWRRGVLAGWSWLVLFAGCAFVLFVNANYPIADNYRRLICLGLTFPRYFLGEFVLASTLLAAALVYRHWRPGGTLLWLDILNVLLILVALVDLRLTQIMEARLDWDVLSLAAGEGPKMMWRMSKPYLLPLVVLVTVVVAIYWWAVAGLGRYLHRPAALACAKRFNVGFAIVCLLLLAVAGRVALGKDKVLGQSVGVLAQSSPLWRQASGSVMDDSQFAAVTKQLGIVTTAGHPSLSSRSARDLNVVFILLESTFNKHLSLFGSADETQPLLSAYKDRMEVFPNFYSSFAGSIHARFACFAGLYPVRDYKQFTQQRVGVKSIFEVLHENGYSNSLFYSSFYDYTNFRDFLRGRNVHEMYDADTMPGERTTKQVSWGLREEETLGAMLDRIKQYAATDRKFFMTYIPAAPHNPYDGVPQRFRKFPPGKFKDYTPQYLNELLYMDWIVTSVIDELKSNGLLDKTLIVITGDHGEMLGANSGPIGHGWALTPELANVPLIIMNPSEPKGFKINSAVGSQVDLLPTLLDSLGIPTPAGQLYQGVSLYSDAAQSDRVIYLNSYRQYAVVEGDNLAFGDRDTAGKNSQAGSNFTMRNVGVETLFDANEALAARAFSIEEFDRFQESFLRNYAHYCRMISSENAAIVSR